MKDTYKIKRRVPRRFTKNVSRGHIVQVELFGHFNKELTFLHPAVVLYDNNKGQLLVAPISTSKYKDNDPLHVDVEPADGLHHGSGVCLESIRGVDKNRVLFQYNKDGKNAKLRTEVLNKIDLTIMEYFCPIHLILLKNSRRHIIRNKSN
ncbi:type II toxin-antitoxin system PemK/MazF family toxin (plasmid) [Priestia megaterium]